jgi:hypothetical protein
MSAPAPALVPSLLTWAFAVGIVANPTFGVLVKIG